MLIEDRKTRAGAAAHDLLCSEVVLGIVVGHAELDVAGESFDVGDVQDPCVEAAVDYPLGEPSWETQAASQRTMI